MSATAHLAGVLGRWPVPVATGADWTVGRLLGAFEAAGFPAYVCGGAVRDLLAGAMPNDVDVAVAAPFDAMRRVLVQALGAEALSAELPAFGVVKIGRGGDAIDVAMLRTPDDIGPATTLQEVMYTRVGALADDARNRDLTVNCAYWHRSAGLVDPLGTALPDIARRAFDMAADPRKAAIDPRLSLRALLFEARGYAMGARAQAHVRARLAHDVAGYGAGLGAYVATLVRGCRPLADGVLAGARRWLGTGPALDALERACTNAGR